jgi:hypothetical protein
MKKTYGGSVTVNKLSESIGQLTVEATMSQSSTPNAFTIFTRTIHRSAFAMIAVATKAMLTPTSSGPRFGVAMMLSGGGCLSHGPGERRTPEPEPILQRGQSDSIP